MKAPADAAVSEPVQRRDRRPSRSAPAAAGGRGGRGGGFGGGLFSGTVASVTPTAEAVTLREHYSLVELPDGNYKPRYDDPRAGYGGLSFVDYSVPIGEPMVQHYIRRHRLREEGPQRRHQRARQAHRILGGSRRARRTSGKALIEGASWWNQAFEAAGFRNAFKVAVLPDGADPMDIRYNMINWVHRSTRGWSIRRHRHRSAHRRDHQGHRDARLPARPPGLPDLRRPALALHHRQREARHPLPDRARAHPPACRARSRPHPRPRPQLLRQQPGLDLRDGLSAPAGEAARRRHHRYLRSLPGAHRRMGQGGHQLRLPRASPRRRAGRARQDPRRRLGQGPALPDQPGHRRASRAWTSGPTASTRPTS